MHAVLQNSEGSKQFGEEGRTQERSVTTNSRIRTNVFLDACRHQVCRGRSLIEKLRDASPTPSAIAQG